MTRSTTEDVALTHGAVCIHELAAARHVFRAERNVAYDDVLRHLSAAARLDAVARVAVDTLRPPLGMVTVEPPPFVSEKPGRVGREGRGLRSRNLALVILAALAVPAFGDVVKEDEPTVKSIVTATELASLTHHMGAVTRVVFHRGLPLMVSTGKDGRVVVWSLDKQNAPTELHKFRWEVWAAKFSPDGTLLAFADRQNGESEVFFKTVADGRQVHVIKDYIEERRSSVASLAFSPDGRLFATGQDDGTIRLWEVPSFTEFKPVSFGSAAVSLAFGRVSVDKKRKRSDYVLAVGCWDGVLKTMDVNFTKDKTPAASRSFAPTNVAFEGNDAIECVRFSPDGKLLAVARHGGHINLHDMQSEQGSREMPFTGGDVTWIGFHPQQPWCVTAHRNERMACIWNYETKKLLCELKGHAAGVSCAEFSPDGRRVATAAEDHSIKLWELTSVPAPAAKKPARRRTSLPALEVGE